MADDATTGGAAPASSEQAQLTEEKPPVPEPASERRPPAAIAVRGTWPSRRALVLFVAFAAPCAVIGLDVFFMLRVAPKNGAPTPSGAPTGPQGTFQVPSLSAAVPKSFESEQPEAPASAPGSAPGESAQAAESGFDEEGADEPSPSKPKEPKHFGSVREAAARSCSTASVEGLSRQIIEQSRCINPNAVVPLPTRPNLVVGAHVFPYLEASARDHLLKVLDARRDGTMTINSALRTVAQQYLVWRWSAGKRCGVQLATPPGDSNHEMGLALDIAEQAAWRSTLEAHDFHWLGASDRVHFDFKGRAPTSQKSTDVLAFQQLWNHNHPKDPIEETGRYNAATEQRLKEAPADGFAIGPRCSKRRG